MQRKLFIDDIREPPDYSYDVVRSTLEAKGYILKYGVPDFISFDHDLGDDDTAFVFVKWLVELDLEEGNWIPDDFEFHVHSANPVGKENINSYLNNYMEFKKYGK